MWEWSKRCQTAFEGLKEAVTEEPILALPDHTKVFNVQMDAFDFAIGEVLMQERHLIAFESYKINDNERSRAQDERVGRQETTAEEVQLWGHGDGEVASATVQDPKESAQMTDSNVRMTLSHRGKSWESILLVRVAAIKIHPVFHIMRWLWDALLRQAAYDDIIVPSMPALLTELGVGRKSRLRGMHARINVRASSSSSREIAMQLGEECADFGGRGRETNNPETELAEIVRKLEFQVKPKLELAHHVQIHLDAINLACQIVERCPVGENCNGREVVVLQQKAAELLEEACLRVRQNVDKNLDEKRLDEAEYLLYRTLVELKEVKKEKDWASRIWIPRVESEYKGLIDKWDSLVGRWNKSVVSSEERAQQTDKLKEVRLKLLSCLNEVQLKSVEGYFYNAVQGLHSITSDLLDSTNEIFKQHITVNECVVAEVASPKVGIPASWLCNSWKPQLQGLTERLMKNVPVQMRAVIGIDNALSRSRSNPSGPIGSLLFLCALDGWGEEFVKALAEQLFDSKDHVIRFNLHSVYPDKASVSDLHPRDYDQKQQMVVRELMEAVRKRPFSVLWLDNIDNAYSYITQILHEIIRHGRLTDCHGNTADFSKTLVVMTSDVGKNKYRLPFCTCLEMHRDVPFKNELFAPENESAHSCSYRPVLQEAWIHFKSGLYDEVDEVIIFKQLNVQEYNAVARFHLRDTSSALNQTGLILYPTEAALRSIAKKSSFKKDFLITRIQGDVVPGLFKTLVENEKDDMAIIYVDVLVGTNELSFRLQRGGPEDDKDYRQLKESIRESRIIYQAEKQRVDKIWLLRRKCFQLLCMADGDGYPFFSFCGSGVCATDVFNEVMQKHEETSNARVRKGVEEILKRSDGECQAIDVVVEAMLHSLSQPQSRSRQPARSFLYLGLTSVGKEELAKGLAERFATSDWAETVIKINLREYCELNSFFQQMDRNFGLSSDLNNEQHGSFPPRVLLVDEVEKAPMSIFSALISLFDYGTLGNSQYQMYDFSNTIVVIMSHLGNKEVLARLVGGTSRADVFGQGSEEVESRFRTELLNRVDEIVMCNPCAAQQLHKISRLPMMSDQHLEDGPPSAIPVSFFHLFERDQTLFKKWPCILKDTVSHLSKGLMRDWSDGVVVRS
ncbi:hypothetical protein RJ640_029285 [Escallonia rubra]|uniref:Uncharacterized protein n=1 Tax=Escallonia rubra TaxID=112253 RepID=A0AA88QSV2_9ASTE|nr:hypothetical protein RJ640_029285 [Escallonia rubra]